MTWKILPQFWANKHSSGTSRFRHESNTNFLSRFQYKVVGRSTLICKKMELHAELIFIWKISHLDSIWTWGTRELGNGLFKLVVQILPLQTRHALLSFLPIPNILNKSSSCALRPALSNLWLLLVCKFILSPLTTGAYRHRQVLVDAIHTINLSRP